MTISSQHRFPLSLIPEWSQRMMAQIPPSIRYGAVYRRTCSEIHVMETWPELLIQSYVFDRVKQLAIHAYAKVPFYREFYRRQQFNPKDLTHFSDLSCIPIVTKADLREVPLQERSCVKPGARLVNTGGTTGQPLVFYLDRHAPAREWAHMHYIWGKRGYTHGDLKLAFRGANTGARILEYHLGQNEYALNIYQSPDQQCKALEGLVARRDIRYLHGYPSAIHEFLKQASERSPLLVKKLRGMVRGILYSSEYPIPLYRTFIETVLPVPSVSWYGHSEMAVLAYEENAEFEYQPMPTYGYCEAVGSEESKRLVATGFDNTCSPFIRYDTGDRIRAKDVCQSRLRSFFIAEGREADFVLDARGNRITLTALIFGRHHPVFNKASFIQISQSEPGRATLWITVSSNAWESQLDWSKEFDSTHVAIEFSFRVIKHPIRTAVGKAPLLIRPEQLPPEFQAR